MKLICYLLALAAVVIGNTANADVMLSRADDTMSEEFYDAIGGRSASARPHLIIMGEIKRGDYEEALNEVKKTYAQGDIGQLFIHLDSPGGDVLEAIKIGYLVRELMLETNVTDKCHSACFLILVAGVKRTVLGDIGIHRPHFEEEYFSGLSADDAQKKYEQLIRVASSYLNEMGVAKELIEKMFQVPSNEMEQLSPGEVLKWILKSPASLEEWLIAKCGSYTKEEENDAFSDDFSNFIMSNKPESKPESEYVNSLRDKIGRVNSCREASLIAERSRVAATLSPTPKTKKTSPDNRLNEVAPR